MIKMMSALRRRSGLTRAAFSAHWRDVHGPLILAHAHDLGIVQYVQSHAAENSVASDCDGVAEVWFESQEAQRRRAGYPAFRAALARVHADEDKFIDRTATRTWWGQETLMLPLVADRT